MGYSLAAAVIISRRILCKKTDVSGSQGGPMYENKQARTRAARPDVDQVQPGMAAASRPVNAQHAEFDTFAYSPLVSAQRHRGASDVVQRQERETTIYKHGKQSWFKHMQIIDSTLPSAYVHMSRSTATDAHAFGTQKTAHPPGFAISGNGSRGTIEHTATALIPHFNRAAFNAANNVHLTLEGRYRQVMGTLISGMYDSRIDVKAGPPVSVFANLNYGNGANHQPAVSNVSITDRISNTAQATIDTLNAFPDAEYAEIKPDLILAATETRDATLALTNQLLMTPVFSAPGAAAPVQYGGAPWAALPDPAAA
jgi:hypothetical protein